MGTVSIPADIALAEGEALQPSIGRVIRCWLQPPVWGRQRRKMIVSLQAMDDWLLRDVVSRFDDCEPLMALPSTRQQAPTINQRLGQRDGSL
jgi:hypothetical protein